MGRSKKALLCVLSQFIYLVVATICGFIIPRLILTTFGSTYNGVIASATKFFDVISVLIIGLAGATRVALYPKLAENDILGISQIVKASSDYMKKVGFVVAAYSIVVMIAFPMISNSSLLWYESVVIVAIVGLASFIQYYFGVTYFTLLEADQRQFVVSLVRIFVALLNALSVYYLIRFCNVFIVKLVSTLVYAITPCFINLYAKKHYGLISECSGNTTFLSQRKAVAFHSIANIVHDQVDVFVLTIFQDAKIVSVYSIYNLVVAGLHSMEKIFTNGLEAGFANLWAKKEIEKFKYYFSLYETLIFTYAAIVFTSCFLLFIPFISLYTKNVCDTNYILPTYAAILVVAEIIYCIRMPYKTLVQAIGDYEQTKFGALGEAIINLVISILAVKTYGLIGVAVGTLIANLFRSAQYAFYCYKNIINKKLYSFFYKLLGLVLLMFAMLKTNSFIFPNLIVDCWGDWIYEALEIFIVCCIMAFSMVGLFYRADFIRIFAMFYKKKNSK